MVERDSRGFLLFVCVFVVHCAPGLGLKKSIKCEQTDVIRRATYPGCLAHCSTATIKQVVYPRVRGSSSPSLYMWSQPQLVKHCLDVDDLGSASPPGSVVASPSNITGDLPLSLAV